jgi:hypothetical protein
LFKLESVGFIEPVKRKYTKHGAIYYQISEAGMFQLVLQKPHDIPQLLPSILDTHGNYSIFETLLYPCFKKETLASIKSRKDPPVYRHEYSISRGTFLNYEIAKVILEYLQYCCVEISHFIRPINRVPGSMPQKALLEILDNKISLLKDVLIMKIFLCFRQSEYEILETEKMNTLSILAQDEKFMKIAQDLQRDFNRSLDFAMHLRTRSSAP